MAALLAVGAMATQALEFYLDDCFYRVNDDGTTVSAYGPRYESVMNQMTTAIIPATVTYEGTTYTVTKLSSGAFCHMPELTIAQIPATVTSIDYYCFRSCPKLEQITVDAGNSVYDSREGCNAIIQTSSNMFVVGCGASFIPNGIKILGTYAFAYSPIQSIAIPATVTSIDRHAFIGCTKLESLTIPASVRTINNGLTSDCTSLRSITVDEANTKYDSREGCNAIIEKSSNTLIAGCATSTVPSGVVKLGNDAFNGCTGLTAITLPNTLTTIGWDVFNGCTNLASVTLPASLRIIQMGAFAGCRSLTSITFPEGLQNIQPQAFIYTGLTEVHIPASVTSLAGSAFVGCEHVTKATIDPANTKYDSREGCNAFIRTADNKLIFGCQNTVIPASVTSIGDDAFYYCRSLKAINIPPSVTTIGQEAFAHCEALEAIEIPNSVTSIDYQGFFQCSSLKKFSLPASVTSVGRGMLSRCSNLEEITIDGDNPVYDSRGDCNAIIETATKSLLSGCMNTVIPDSIINIGSDAFWGVTGLKTVTLPASITALNFYAFCECSGLTDFIVLVPDPADIEVDSWSIYEVPYATCTLRVPQGSVELYRATEPWSNFEHIVEIATIGDVNGDYLISGADVTTLYNALLDGTPCHGNPDVNGDGIVSGADVTALYNLLLY
ncbi:MAG: leucine-rich repeat protein [Muribaculaceae bacterium]|nr:leucine-rich repeat protein [Muribaculaceae bacterium]